MQNYRKSYKQVGNSGYTIYKNNEGNWVNWKPEI